MSIDFQTFVVQFRLVFSREKRLRWWHIKLLLFNHRRNYSRCYWLLCRPVMCVTAVQIFIGAGKRSVSKFPCSISFKICMLYNSACSHAQQFLKRQILYKNKSLLDTQHFTPCGQVDGLRCFFERYFYHVQIYSNELDDVWSVCIVQVLPWYSWPFFCWLFLLIRLIDVHNSWKSFASSSSFAK